MVAGLAQPVVGELANEFDVGLIRGAHRVLKCPLIGVAVIGLRVRALPGEDFFFIHPHLVLLHPGVELGQDFAVVVFADPGVVAVIPAVHTADQVVAGDVAVGHQRAAVGAAPVQYRNPVVVADDHQVNVGNQRVGWFAILKRVPVSDLQFFHLDLDGMG